MTSQTLKLLLATCILLAPGPAIFAQDEPAVPPEEQEQLPVDSGYAEAFSFLQESIAFRAYAGVLKGAEGTLDDGSGNSLDRALLLIKLLQEKGYRPAIAHGRLSGEALERVIALSQGLQPDPETGSLPSINPAARETLEGVLADHYWVQIPVGEELWIDLDPTLPDSTPGNSIAGFRKRILRLPSHLFQLIEISVWVEFSIDQQPVRSRLLRWTKPIFDVDGKPIVLFFVRREADGRFVYSENKRWYPVLWFDGAILPALNLEAEANRLAVRARGVVKPPEVNRIWMEISISAPGQRNVPKRRVLYAAAQQTSNRLNEMHVLRVGVKAPLAGNLVAVASSLELSAAKAAGISPTEYPQVLSDNERNEIAVLADVQRELGAAIGSNYEAALVTMRRCVDDAFLSLPGTLLPRVYSVSISPNPANLQLDLINFDVTAAAINPRDVQAVAAGFTLGVAASHLEGNLLARFSERMPAISSLTLTREHLARDTEWRAFDLSSVSALDDVEGFDDDLLARMEESIQAGKIIILPLQRNGLPLVWWELDSNSGTAVGMIEPGIGGARLAPQDAEDWPYVASSFAPLFESAWPEHLAAWCRTAATLMLENGIILTSSNTAQAVQDVYELMYTALVTDPDIVLSPGVREFFSPYGRILLQATIGSLCNDESVPIAQP